VTPGWPGPSDGPHPGPACSALMGRPGLLPVSGAGSARPRCVPSGQPGIAGGPAAPPRSTPAASAVRVSGRVAAGRDPALHL